MRLYAHILALLLAAVLVAKPCATVLAATAAEATDSAGFTQGIAAKTPTAACESKCLKARLENQRRDILEPATQSTDPPAKLTAAFKDTNYKFAIYVKEQAAQHFVLHRSSRQILCELCRQLT